MAKENEIEILDVNKRQAIKRLRELRAKHIGSYRFKRVEFLLKGDVKGFHSWGRVRTDGKKTIITLKEMRGEGGYTAMNEYEVEVDNFEETVRIVRKLVNSRIFIYFENDRDAYLLGRVQITIDKWPRIPTFVEIEAPTMKEVRETYKLLKIKGRFVGNAPIHKIYGRYGLGFRKVMEKNKPALERILKGSNK